MYTLWFGIFPSCAKRNQKRKEVVLRWMISFGIRCDGTVVHDPWAKFGLNGLALCLNL